MDIEYKYRKEFALLPIQLESGDFCWFKSFYTKIACTTHGPWDSVTYTDVGRYIKEDLIMDRLKGN